MESHGPRLSPSEETTNEKESSGTRAKKCQRGVSEHYRPSEHDEAESVKDLPKISRWKMHRLYIPVVQKICFLDMCGKLIERKKHYYLLIFDIIYFFLNRNISNLKTKNLIKNIYIKFEILKCIYCTR